MTDFIINTDRDWKRLNREQARAVKAVWCRAQIRYAHVTSDTDPVTDRLFAKLRAAASDGLRLYWSWNFTDNPVPDSGSAEEAAIWAWVDRALAAMNGRVEVLSLGNESVDYQAADITDDGTGHYPAIEFQKRWAAHLVAQGHTNFRGEPLRIYAGGGYVAFYTTANKNAYAQALCNMVRDTADFEGLEQHLYAEGETQIRNGLTFLRSHLGTKPFAFTEGGTAPEMIDRIGETLATCVGTDFCTTWGRDPDQTFQDYYNERAADPSTPAESQAFVDGVAWLQESVWIPLLWDVAQDFGPTTFAISTGCPLDGFPATYGAWPAGTVLISGSGMPYLLNTLHSHITQYDAQRQRLYVKTTRLAGYLALHELTDSYRQAQADGSGVWLSLDDSSPSYVDPYYWTTPEPAPSVGGSALKYLSPVSARSPSAKTKAGRSAPVPSTTSRREATGKAMKNDKPSTEDKDADFLARVREWFRTTASFESKVRTEMLDDLKFVRIGGAEQWPTYARDARNTPGQERPMLTDNRIKRYRTSVINQIRQNTPAIKVRPVDDQADKKTADILQGVIRNIENVSRAANALDKAVEFAVDCGRGYFGLHTKYVSDDTWDQDIAFRLIPDPFKVYYDPWSVEPDGSDAKAAMLVENMPQSQFEREYPDVELQDWAEGTTGDRDWMDEENVRVAEFFELIEKPAELVLTQDGRTVWSDELTEGDVPMQTRKTTRKTCGWWKIAGNQILESGELPTSYIPIIPVYGEESWIEGKHEINGLVRAAKSPQMLLNFWLSAVAEQIALQPKVPWVGPAGVFEGFEDKWSSANSKNHAYLEYEPVTLGGTVLPAPSRQAPPPIPTGYTEQMNVALDGIRAAVGMEDPMIGAGQGPDQSGRAIRSLQEQGAIATMHFADNLAKSVGHAGRILIEMIPKVYDTRRVLRILGEDGEAEHAEHDPAQPQAMTEVQEETGEVRRIYNLAVGRYDCVAMAGPSYSTKRQEGFDALTQLVQAMPQLSQLAGDLILRLADMPYSDEMADRLKAALPPEILAATEGDETDPQVMAAQAQMQQLQQQLMMLQQQLQQAMDERALKEGELQLKSGELQVKQYDAETKRMALLKPEQAAGPDPQAEMQRQFSIDEALTKLQLAVEEGERKQEAHEREMRAPFPVPAANALQGGGPITGN